MTPNQIIEIEPSTNTRFLLGMTLIGNKVYALENPDFELVTEENGLFYISQPERTTMNIHIFDLTERYCFFFF